MGDVPVVISRSTSHDTANACPPSGTSTNGCECQSAGGLPAMFHNQTAISPRDTNRSGLNKQALCKPVMSLSRDHCTGAVK